MSVPNTSTFSLDDVRTEIGLSSSASLDDCFTSAYSSGFDATYEGSKDRLSNFRNYQHFVAGDIIVRQLSHTKTSEILSVGVGIVDSSYASLSTVIYHFSSPFSYPQSGDETFSEDEVIYRIVCDADTDLCDSTTIDVEAEGDIDWAIGTSTSAYSYGSSFTSPAQTVFNTDAQYHYITVRAQLNSGGGSLSITITAVGK